MFDLHQTSTTHQPCHVSTRERCVEDDHDHDDWDDGDEDGDDGGGGGKALAEEVLAMLQVMAKMRRW